MDLGIEWSRPIQLKDGKQFNLIYFLDADRLPNAHGVYVFGRRWGGAFEALYVGKAKNIRGRVRVQLNNLKLMQHVKNAKGGKRILLIGNFVGKPGQSRDKSVTLIERALIRYFLSEGHDLVNKQGTRRWRHEIQSVGEHPKKFIPKLMYAE